jgi:hypothetical protein
MTFRNSIIFRFKFRIDLTSFIDYTKLKEKKKNPLVWTTDQITWHLGLSFQLFEK